jgi:8-amino-7-oxononanoate synthase
VATLAEEGDLLLSDQLNHASLIDGCRASYATRFVYPHADLRAVGELLRTHRHKHARAWIITDGVFGMDGDVAPLEGLCDLAEQYDAHVIVDEAHGTGVLGSDGSGSCDEMRVKSRVAIRIGTLSKAIGSHGGFVVGPQTVIDYLVNRCRSLIFSTAGSPLAVSAAITAVESITREPERRQHVRQLATQLRERMNDIGLTSETSKLTSMSHGVCISGVPIIPLVVGANERALSLASKLRESGFFVPAIRPPTVPSGTARLRISLTAAHQWEQIEHLLAAISGDCSAVE